MVSIIVPIFNAEQYLNECLHSILSQTYPDIEVICINDGSTDNSAEIIKVFADKDPRIKIISKANGGLSSARNEGLKACSGEYIAFVDADDILNKDAVQTMLNTITSDDADILVFGTHIFPANPGSDSYIKASDKMIPSRRCYLGKDIYERALFEEDMCNVYVWNKLYRRTLFESGIQFDEAILFGEDRCFLFDIFPYAHKLTMIADTLYNYRQSTSSLTGKYAKKPFERTMWKVKLIEHIIKSWHADNTRISLCGKMKLISWSESYLHRSVAELTTSERDQIMNEYKRIKETYVR